MLKATFKKYSLNFKLPAITSRATMLEKDTYFIKIWDDSNPQIYGLGECAIFKGLGADDKPNYEHVLCQICQDINNITPQNIEYSSIRFGVETALLDLKNGGVRKIFDSNWSNGLASIQINGLIWMGTFNEMFERINQKLEAGFNCIKLKIGGIDFNKEIKLLKYIRSNFPSNNLEIRLDANGAFNAKEALPYLEKLSKYNIHSIEQPIKPGQWVAMEKICKNSPIPIALDEELIGVEDIKLKEQLLRSISPAYIILKPSLCGGFYGADEWIKLANDLNIGWWATSALESNIGLNAIAQWISTYRTSLPQGLGTGALYSNNIESPLEQIDDVLLYNPKKSWEIPSMIL